MDTVVNRYACVICEFWLFLDELLKPDGLVGWLSRAIHRRRRSYTPVSAARLDSMQKVLTFNNIAGNIYCATTTMANEDVHVR